MAPRLRKPVGLRKRAEFVWVQENGRRFRGKLMTLIVTEREQGARIGYTASRKVGNAVVRNRVRRRLREVVRLHTDRLAPASDHVVIAHTQSADADYRSLQIELLCLLEHANIWRRPSLSPSA